MKMGKYTVLYHHNMGNLSSMLQEKRGEFNLSLPLLLVPLHLYIMCSQPNSTVLINILNAYYVTCPSVLSINFQSFQFQNQQY